MSKHYFFFSSTSSETEIDASQGRVAISGICLLFSHSFVPSEKRNVNIYLLIATRLLALRLLIQQFLEVLIFRSFSKIREFLSI